VSSIEQRDANTSYQRQSQVARREPTVEMIPTVAPYHIIVKTKRESLSVEGADFEKDADIDEEDDLDIDYDEADDDEEDANDSSLVAVSSDDTLGERGLRGNSGAGGHKRGLRGNSGAGGHKRGLRGNSGAGGHKRGLRGNGGPGGHRRGLRGNSGAGGHKRSLFDRLFGSIVA
jgi:hypothetical protein